MKQQQKPVSKQTKQLTYALYILLVIFIIAYALYNNIIIGAAAFTVIVVLVIVEVRSSVQSEGTMKSVYDIGIAIAAAIALWIVLVAVLHTTSPIDAVASCSMLPVLHRGDLVALHGISNPAQFIAEHNITVVNVSTSAMDSMLGNLNSEFLAYYVYFHGNTSQIYQIFNATGYSVGLYNTGCITAYADRGEAYNYGKCMVNSQGNNLVKYNYTFGNVTLNGQTLRIIETSNITIGNTTISEDYNNPIIVYRTTPTDYFTGDIIHRVYAVIHAGSSYYFLTKGDNNPGLDMQFANSPPPLNQTVGYVVGDIPVLGYIKLILNGQLGTVAGCNQQILR